MKVWLFGVDAPERGMPLSQRAKEFVSGLVFGQSLRVMGRGGDRYGRTIADVILQDGRNLNHEVVRAGLAWWYRRYAPQDKTLEQLENEGRQAKRGLWNDANPIPLWEQRQNNRLPTPP